MKFAKNRKTIRIFALLRELFKSAETVEGESHIDLDRPEDGVLVVPIGCLKN